MKATRRLEPGTFKVAYVRKSDNVLCVSPTMSHADAMSFAKWLRHDPTVIQPSIEVIA